jgi:hypothetical protein
MGKQEAADYVAEMRQLAKDLREIGNALAVGGTVTGGAGSMAARSVIMALLKKAGIIAAALGFTAIMLGAAMIKWADQLDVYANTIDLANAESADGVIISFDRILGGWHVTIVNRGTGHGYTMPMAYGPAEFVIDGPMINGPNGSSVWLSGIACTRSGGNPSPGNWYNGDSRLCQ